MENSGFISSDLTEGEQFRQTLLYVQYVDKEKDTASETPDGNLKEYLVNDRTDFTDLSFTKYLRNPRANLIILKESLKDKVTFVKICSNPFPNPFQQSDVTIHEFVVFMTENYSNGHLRKTWWSLETDGQHIILQQSKNKDDVIYKILYDTEKKEIVKRSERPVIDRKNDWGAFRMDVEEILRTIWGNNQISEPFHTVTSNSQLFASFIFEKIITTVIGLSKMRAFRYKSIFYDQNFDFYRAMMEGRREDFEKLLTNDLTIECLNSADSQGYNLLEWGTAFSSSDWPIDEELKLRGAEIPSVEGLFRRNVFFIALQYLPPNRKSQFLSLDRIDISGVNKMGDTALHLFLYEEEWKLAEEILNQFESYDVNITNSLEDTPLLLAARLNCEFGLFKKIVNRTNSENVNKADGTGNTALHYAMYNKSEIKVKELLNHKDVDVNVKNNEDNRTALHLASNWQYIPMDLFENILQRSADINAKDKYGNTALHLAIMFRLESDEFKINQLLGDVRVNVDIKNNEMDTALCLASKFLTRTRATTFPSDLFKKIIQNSADVNAQDKDGNTPLHIAILRQSEIGAKELLKHNDVNVAVENNLNQAVYRFDSRYWPDIPEDLAGKIYRKSVYYKNTMTYFIIGMFISTVLSICWFVFYE